MRRSAFLVVLACCGDGVPQDPTDEAVSGSRLKLEWVFYADGSRQPAAGTFYDLELHARCVPTSWTDGVVRCAPIADPAGFRDPECTMPVGIALSGNNKPDYFIGYDLYLGGFEARPARLYRAGPNVSPPAFTYQLHEDGACELGPTAPAVLYFEAIAAFDPDAMVALEDRSEARDGDPLTLVVRETADGMRVPVGLRDNTLDLPCTPQQRGEQTVCAPDATDADVFLDPSCVEPGVAVLEGFLPNVVRAFGTDGCPTEHALGEPRGTTMYRRTHAGCVLVPADVSVRAFALGPAIATPVLERTVDDTSGQRLQRVTLSAGGLRWRAADMFDTATRSDCRAQVLGMAYRCLPATSAPMATLLAPGCGFEVRVAELRAPTCNRVGFASSFGSDNEVRAIGDAAPSLFSLAGGTCAPYTPPQGTVVHDLGPPLPPETFTPGILAGER